MEIASYPGSSVGEEPGYEAIYGETVSSDVLYGMLGGNFIADECGRYELSFMWKAME